MPVEQFIKLTDLNPGDKLVEVEKGEIEFTVWRYQVGHSVMIIRLELENEAANKDEFYFCFESVEYFDGPIRWAASDLYIATQDECADILTKTKTRSHVPYNLLPLHFRLVKANTSHQLEVKIIASKITVTQDITSYLL